MCLEHCVVLRKHTINRLWSKFNFNRHSNLFVYNSWDLFYLGLKFVYKLPVSRFSVVRCFQPYTWFSKCCRGPVTLKKSIITLQALSLLNIVLALPKWFPPNPSTPRWEFSSSLSPPLDLSRIHSSGTGW